MLRSHLVATKQHIKLKRFWKDFAHGMKGLRNPGYTKLNILNTGWTIMIGRM